MAIKIRDQLVASAVLNENGLAENVKLLGSVSANGYRYTSGAIQRGAPLYADVPVYINHSNGNRKYEDRIGTVKTARATSEGIYGAVQFNTSHPLYSQLKSDFESKTPMIGFSHYASVAMEDEDVTDIIEVYSVDVVTEPATTKTFSEQTQEGQDMKEQKELLEQIQQLTEKYEDAVASRVKVAEQLGKLEEERDALIEKLESLEAEKAEQERTEAFAKLIEGKQISDEMRETLDELHADGHVQHVESLVSNLPDVQEQDTAEPEGQKPQSKRPGSTGTSYEQFLKKNNLTKE